MKAKNVRMQVVVQKGNETIDLEVWVRRYVDVLERFMREEDE